MKGYKTILFGAAVAALGSIQATDLAQIVPPQHIGLVMSLIGFAVIGLRGLTTTPVGKTAQ